MKEILNDILKETGESFQEVVSGGAKRGMPEARLKETLSEVNNGNAKQHPC